MEYKWRLGPEHTQRLVAFERVLSPARRVDRLATQMKFRLTEGLSFARILDVLGSGSAYYLLGVRDSGYAEAPCS